MSRILNYIIVFLVIGILIVGGIIAYKLISFEEHTVTFYLNGATTIANKRVTCEFSFKGCIIELPMVTREDGIIIGYSFDKDSHTANYKPGDKIKVDDDYKMYAISYKNVVITIDRNNTSYLEKDKLSCIMYNSDESCKLKMPMYNKIGYQLEGFSESKDVSRANSSYFQNQEYEFNDSKTLYPNYTSKRSGKHNVVYNSGNQYIVENKNIMEFEDNIDKDIIEEYKGIFNRINQLTPYYLNGTKVTVLNYNTFNGIWGGRGNVLGINYSYNGSKDDIPVSRSVDVLYLSKLTHAERYYTLVHELGHSFDFYYGYGIDRPSKITDIYISATGSKSISSQSDIKSLYNKYKNNRQRPLRDYAYTNVYEFTAESFAYYYLTFIDPTTGYSASKYPTDLKTTIEKYLCVAKNNYDPTKC